MSDLAVLCHPSRTSQAEEFAAQVSEELGTGEQLATVADDQCPVGKFYIVNRDYFDHFAENPWEVME
jgi:hypothetical protein